MILLAKIESLSGRTIAVSLVISAVLIALNGLFVAYEFGILASKKVAFDAAADAGNRVARAASSAMSDLSIQLAGAQLGITVNSVALGYVAEPALASLLAPLLGSFASDDLTSAVSYGLALGLVVLVQLVLGEMVPKNIALANPERTTRFLVLPYRAYLSLVRPVVRLLRSAAVAGTRMLGIEPADEVSTARSASELAEIVLDSSEGGAIDADSAQMLRLAIDFAEKPISSVTRPIDRVAMVRLGTSGAQIERVAAVSGHTRIPVATSDSQGGTRFVGYVHVKDLIRLDSESRSRPVPDSFVRPMLVVGPDRTLIDVLRMMRSLRRHVGVVTTGGSEPMGIVSIEDVVEALAAVSRPD